MPHRRIPSVTIAIVLALGACAVQSRSRPSFGMPHAPGTEEGGAVGPNPARAGGLPAGRKKVVDKNPPVTLVARDRSWCTVSENKFHDVAVGDEVTCSWRSPDAGR